MRFNTIARCFAGSSFSIVELSNTDKHKQCFLSFIRCTWCHCNVVSLMSRPLPTSRPRQALCLPSVLPPRTSVTYFACCDISLISGLRISVKLATNMPFTIWVHAMHGHCWKRFQGQRLKSRLQQDQMHLCSRGIGYVLTVCRRDLCIPVYYYWLMNLWTWTDEEWKYANADDVDGISYYDDRCLKIGISLF